jgi:hypothetical protein
MDAETLERWNDYCCCCCCCWNTGL